MSFNLPLDLQINNTYEITIDNNGLKNDFIESLKKYYNYNNDKINNHIKKIKKSISTNYKQLINHNNYESYIHDHINFINYLNKILFNLKL